MVAAVAAAAVVVVVAVVVLTVGGGVGVEVGVGVVGTCRLQCVFVAMQGMHILPLPTFFRIVIF